MNKLIENYENAVNAVIAEFKTKQGLDQNQGCWIGDFVGEVFDFGDTLTFDFRDILVDLKENAPTEEIFKWRNYMLRIWQLNNMAGGVLLPEVNYRNWLHGCPRLSDEEISTVEGKWKNFINELAELGKSKMGVNNETAES